MKNSTNPLYASPTIDLMQDESVIKNFVISTPQKLEDGVKQDQRMWKRTGSPKWQERESDLEANRAGKWRKS